MDIKLVARLTAYSKVETFDKQGSSSDHTCNMRPLNKESIDELFRMDVIEPSIPTQPVGGKEFIDSLF